MINPKRETNKTQVTDKMQKQVNNFAAKLTLKLALHKRHTPTPENIKNDHEVLSSHGKS
jgi:hypothetical protein